jgi:beta-glucosidase
MFDPPEMVPYAQIPYEANDAPEHRQLALEAARQSIVLLKNEGGLLPLAKDLKCVAVIGPNADALDVLLGNYYGTPSQHVTALEGIRAKVSPDTKVIYAQGCEIASAWRDGFSEALAAADRADAAVMCLGISPKLEGEEGDAAFSEAGGDRARVAMSDAQQELLQAVCALGKPVVLVLFNGSAVAINWASEHVPAIIDAWYPGEEGGAAIADVLFGDHNPAGRLPVTFVKSLDQLPPFEDYSMKGRTYRYLEDEPLYPFGFGLSFTTFAYSDLSLSAQKIGTDETLEVGVQVENTGSLPGDEVVQLYLSDLEASVAVPIRQLVDFQRITLGPGEKQRVTFTLTPRQLALIDEDGRAVLEPGRFRLSVGGSQGDARSLALGAAAVVTAEFEVSGDARELPY